MRQQLKLPNNINNLTNFKKWVDKRKPIGIYILDSHKIIKYMISGPERNYWSSFNGIPINYLNQNEMSQLPKRGQN
jgi:hypothetical protein